MLQIDQCKSCSHSREKSRPYVHMHAGTAGTGPSNTYTHANVTRSMHRRGSSWLSSVLLFFSCISLSCQLDLTYVCNFSKYHLVTQLRTYATTSGFYTYISMSKCETTGQQPIRSSGGARVVPMEQQRSTTPAPASSSATRW